MPRRLAPLLWFGYGVKFVLTCPRFAHLAGGLITPPTTQKTIQARWAFSVFRSATELSDLLDGKTLLRLSRFTPSATADKPLRLRKLRPTPLGLPEFRSAPGLTRLIPGAQRFFARQDRTPAFEYTTMSVTSTAGSEAAFPRHTGQFRLVLLGSPPDTVRGHPVARDQFLIATYEGQTTQWCSGGRDSSLL